MFFKIGVLKNFPIFVYCKHSYFMVCRQWHLALWLNLEKIISNQKTKVYTARMIICDFVMFTILPFRKATGRTRCSKQREMFKTVSNDYKKNQFQRKKSVVTMIWRSVLIYWGSLTVHQLLFAVLLEGKSKKKYKDYKPSSKAIQIISYMPYFKITFN